MKGAGLLILAIGLAGLIFWLFPGLDLAAAALFFDGTGFPIAANNTIEALRSTLYTAEDLAAAATLILLGITWFRRVPILNLVARDWGYQLAVFAFGPGVMSHYITKPLWGRTRPFRITQFGGDGQFTQVWQWSDQCKSNCSFVSGEVSGATALTVALLMILGGNKARMPQGRYRTGQFLALSLPIISAWQRMAAGKHYLSDVLFAGLFVSLIATLLHVLFYPAKPPPSAVDNASATP